MWEFLVWGEGGEFLATNFREFFWGGMGKFLLGVLAEILLAVLRLRVLMRRFFGMRSLRMLD